MYGESDQRSGLLQPGHPLLAYSSPAKENTYQSQLYDRRQPGDVAESFSASLGCISTQYISDSFEAH
jgi:hypothetical protein